MRRLFYRLDNKFYIDKKALMDMALEMSIGVEKIYEIWGKEIASYHESLIEI